LPGAATWESIAAERDDTVLTARLLATAAFGALLLLPGLGRMGALDSTDARYLAIAREMADTGAWLVPQLAGVPHLDKPPLAYWTAAAGLALWGPSEAAGRFAQQLALIATALLVAVAAARLAERRWAWVAPLALLTMGLPFGASRGLATDVLQLALVTPALLLGFAGARRRSARPVAAALALLGVSMLAKGPIALVVAAAVWLGWAAAARSAARLPLCGVAVGALLFAAIGLPWYALLVQREPAVLDWWLHVQLASRVTGGGAGHTKDVAYLLRAWLLGLLPWTPLVLLSLWRLRPRGRARDADPAGAFLFAWALAPVAVFSLFATKLAAYVLPVFPAAALAVARAGSRGLLDDRVARGAIAFAWLLPALAAGTAGGALLAEAAFARDWVPSLAVAGGTSLALACVLLAAGAGSLALARRVLRTDPARACAAAALLTGLVLAAGFQAVAPHVPTLREEARLVQSVPGARAVELSFKPSLFFYAGDDVPVYVAGVRGLVEPFVDPASARRLTLTRDDALALLREDRPTFALADHREAEALARESGAAPVRVARRYTLLANPPALRALGGGE
jgi:4-amino-4-deoxy-L-arabinose transferase-like glycosyltransferase